jgi:hypothetical protein
VPVTATGAGADGGGGVGVGVGTGVVGGGVTVVGVAVGVSWQVQVGVVGGVVGGVVYEVELVGVGWSSPLGDVDASAEFETSSTVKLVAASAMLASPAIFERFVSFSAVTRFLLAAGKSGARTGGLRPVAPLVIALQCPGVPIMGHQGAMLSKDRHVTGWSAL